MHTQLVYTHRPAAITRYWSLVYVAEGSLKRPLDLRPFVWGRWAGHPTGWGQWMAVRGSSEAWPQRVLEQSGHKWFLYTNPWPLVW